MIATTHALVGAMIASRLQDPILAPIAGFASHFILDSIPHWDFGTSWQTRSKTTTGIIAIADTLIGIIAAYVLFAPLAPLHILLATIAASELPDWLEAPWYMFFANTDADASKKNDSWIKKTAYFLHHFQNGFHTKAPFPLGVLTQIATILFFWILLIAR